MLYSIVGMLVIILDQAVKFWVSDTLFGADVVAFIPGVLSLVNVHNDGAAFSFLSGSGARIYFIIATGVFTLLVIIALATNFIRGKFSRWCLVLVAAGGLGNMIDRIFYGYVQDMFKVELFNFAIFNVADVFITVFAILFALSMIFERPESDNIDVLYEDDEEEEKPKKLSRKERKALKAAEKKAASLETAAASGAAAAEQLEAAAPVLEKKSAVRNARKARQDKYEQEYEEYKVQQRAAMDKKKSRAEAAPAPKAAPAPAAPAYEPDGTMPAPKAKAEAADPFAAWDLANVHAGESEASGYAGRLMDAPVSAPRAEKPRAKAAPVSPAPAPKPAPKAAEPKPAPRPAPKPAESVDEEFSLDDILAEFK